jgi:hypothetical protein
VQNELQIAKCKSQIETRICVAARPQVRRFCNPTACRKLIQPQINAVEGIKSIWSYLRLSAFIRGLISAMPGQLFHELDRRI